MATSESWPIRRIAMIAHAEFTRGKDCGSLFLAFLILKRKLSFELSAFHELPESHEIGVKPPKTKSLVVKINVNVFD
jgi:hypothetical protein